MPRPICAPCRTEMTPKKNGYRVHLRANGQPYQLWDGDLWECRRCGVEVVIGFGQNPVAVHFEPEFPRFLATSELEVD